MKNLSNKSGQSIAEYSLMLAMIMGSLMLMGFDLYPRFIHAFQLYFDSFFFMLNLPIP
ncbi:hypothetical protein KKF34_18115 [Myxococcota bacterium]|nr:hypothetical protein [Myxococcota bacterium]MBU1379305.1 hypothetical protein [Myxococcota bacterium]MBU1498801.1 hypothetical protein [Myxococcota bacterium]